MLQLQAQNKALTMEDALTNPALQPENLRMLTWVAGSDDFTFIKQNNGEQVLVRGNATAGKQREILTLKQLNAAVEAIGVANFSSYPALHWRAGNSFVVDGQQSIIEFDIKTNKARLVTTYAEEAENTELDPTMQRVAYTKGNNLFVSAPGAPDVAITNEPNEAIVHGQAAHRSEFGISKGTFWSPSGQLLAFYRMDQGMVTDYPLVDINPLPAKQNNIKYPMAGGKSHEVTVGVYNIKTKKTTYLKTGEPADQYLTNITWSPDEKHIYVAVLNRDQNHMQLNSYNAETGAFERTLFEEKQEKYVSRSMAYTLYQASQTSLCG
ncbi:hypothetical protein GCM10028895_20400 [Pontibacter rugosus]